jgi:hypothetical protein
MESAALLACINPPLLPLYMHIVASKHPCQEYFALCWLLQQAFARCNRYKRPDDDTSIFSFMHEHHWDCRQAMQTVPASQDQQQVNKSTNKSTCTASVLSSAPWWAASSMVISPTIANLCGSD